MHAHALVSPAPATAARSLLAAGELRPGQHFIRLDSPSEVLAPMSFAAAEVTDTRYTWAVVIAVNHDSEGYLPGQLLRLRRDALVRRVHEAVHAVYVLEQ